MIGDNVVPGKTMHQRCTLTLCVSYLENKYDNVDQCCRWATCDDWTSWAPIAWWVLEVGGPDWNVHISEMARTLDMSIWRTGCETQGTRIAKSSRCGHPTQHRAHPVPTPLREGRHHEQARTLSSGARRQWTACSPCWYVEATYWGRRRMWRVRVDVVIGRNNPRELCLWSKSR